MAIDITINGSVTLDESAGLQAGIAAAPPEDNDDSDVSLATLQADPGASVFYNRLFTAGGLNLSSAFATANGVARSASNYISLTGTGSIISLGFVTTAGAALPVYSAGATSATGAACNLTALSGGTIGLFSDSVLGNRVVYGVDTQGHIVFAMFMDPAASLATAEVWMVQFEAFSNPVATNHDDPLTMTGLGVGAGTTTQFNFNELPSGANLFGMLGSGTSGLIVFGTTTVLKGDGTYKNPASDVIQTSQAGPNATIGINSQMFDVGDSAYFTYVKNPDANYTGFNLSPNEADDADNLRYGDSDPTTNDTLQTASAFLQVAQIQSGTVASMSITAYNIDGSPQQRALLLDSGDNPVAVTRVVVYAADRTTVLDDSNAPATNNPNISFIIDAATGVATVSGFEAGYWIEWYTSGLHDQVKIAGVGGKFDIGGFGINEPTAIFRPLTGVRFEDDGPAVDLVLNGAAELRLDETDNDADDLAVGGILATNSLLAAAYLTTDSANFGSDGAAGANPTVWSLSLTGANAAGVDSGLDDAVSNNNVMLFVVNSTTIVGRDGGAGGALVMTISINATTGELTVVQNRAVEHNDPADHDEAGLSSAMMNSGLVAAVRTVTDGDGDSASDNADVSQVIKFEDDGPAVDLVLNGAAEVTVDESTLPASDSVTAAVLFSVNSESYGSDGQGANASVYKLLLADDNSGLLDTATGNEVLLSINTAGTLIIGAVNGGANEVFRIALNASTGEVTLTQSRAMINGDPLDPDESDTPLSLPANLVGIQRTLTDGDGDSASDNVDISSIFKFEDDGPSQTPPSPFGIELRTDDTDITDLATLSTDVIFSTAPNFGSDGPHAINPIDHVLRLATNNGDSGLIDTATGRSVRLVTVGDDIVGYVDANGDGVIGAGETLEAIRYSLTPVVGDPDTETVNFTQSRSVVHAIADPAETFATNLVFIDRIATDGDGDVSGVVSFDLGEITFILDDEPSIGPIADGLVQFSLNSFVTKTLNGVVGNDPNSAPYILTSYTSSLTINGVNLQGVLAANSQSVTYYADTSGNGTFGDAGDTAYYNLALNEAGAGTYTFTVLVEPPPALTEFRFDDLPSGSNLFGIVGDAAAGLVIFGQTIALKADNTYIANLTQEVKTSQAGLHDTIGIESQMFDPGDAAYFTFVSNPDPNFTGTGLGSTEADDADNILYGSTLENDSAFIRIAQLQGNTAPSMSIQLFNIAGSPQGKAMLDARGVNAAGKDPDITDVRVYDALNNLIESYSAPVAGNGLTITIAANGVATVTGFGTDYKIEWDADEDFDQTLITGVAGKFDIGGFGFNQVNDTPDQLLAFTAQVTDGDADTDTASWQVGIDGTGIYDNNIVSGLII